MPFHQCVRTPFCFLLTFYFCVYYLNIYIKVVLLLLLRCSAQYTSAFTSLQTEERITQAYCLVFIILFVNGDKYSSFLQWIKFLSICSQKNIFILSADKQTGYRSSSFHIFQLLFCVNCNYYHFYSPRGKTRGQKSCYDSFPEKRFLY